MPLPEAAKTFTTGLSPVGKQANRPAGEEMQSPFGGWRHHLPPAERWDNKGPQSSPFISSSQHNGALFCPLQRRKSGVAG